LRNSRGIAFFPNPARQPALCGRSRRRPGCSSSSAYRRLMARTVVLRPSNGWAAIAAFSQIMIVFVRIAFPDGRFSSAKNTPNYVSIAYVIFHDWESQD
jgi:hypothetical protein